MFVVRFVLVWSSFMVWTCFSLVGLCALLLFA